MPTTYLSPGVYVEEQTAASRPIEGVGTAVAAFVGVTERGPVNQPVLVTNWSQYVQSFGEFVDGAYLPLAVYGYYLNGGGSCYIVNVASGNGSTATTPSVPEPVELGTGGDQSFGVYNVRALGPAEPGKGPLQVEIVHTEGEGAAADGFTLIVKQGDETAEEFDGLLARRGRQGAAAVVTAKSRLVRLEEVTGAGAIARPAAGTVAVPRPPAPAPVPALRAETYVGDVATRSGLGALEALDTVTMVAMPDLMSAYQQGALDAGAVKTVQLAIIDHCELMGDRIAVLDPPPGLNAQQIRDWRVDLAGYDSKYAALYWPWLSVFDPATGTNVSVPPSGHIAGLWARSDNERGVYKAPANEIVRGAVDLELNITKNEHDLLNPVGINCVRTFPGRGTRVWGARTLSSDSSWRYLNVRRYFNYLEESILLGTQWCVFEPNDAALWGRIRRTVTSFLMGEWRRGALFGLKPEQAFFVKCDAENNTPESVEAGIVVCEIGAAPVRPAEFVVFKLSQFAGGSTLSE